MSFTTILYLTVIAILIFIIILASQKIKNQEADIDRLTKENSKQSDALRLKGIEVDRLVKRVKKAENLINCRIVKK